jgi:hypothetical protein
MTYTGRMRIYFNRHQAAPLVWCVACVEGDSWIGWELAVSEVHITGLTKTVYRPKEVADEVDGHPSAWLEVEGILRVNAGVANIVANWAVAP